MIPFWRMGSTALFCERCCCLNLTEEQQQDLISESDYHFDHRCMKFQVQLFHMGNHPDIFRAIECFDYEATISLLFYWR